MCIPLLSTPARNENKFVVKQLIYDFRDISATGKSRVT